MSSPFLGSSTEEATMNWEDHIKYGFKTVIPEHENCPWCAKAQAYEDLAVDSAIDLARE